MNTSQAISRVHKLISDSLMRDYGSQTLLKIFDDQIHTSLIMLRQEFRRAKNKGEETIIWPKMVTQYKPCPEREIVPVWGPIKNEQGDILGLRFLQKTQTGLPRKPRVHLEWHPS